MKSIQDVKNSLKDTVAKVYDNSLEFVSLSLANILNSNLRNLIIKKGLDPDKSPKNAYRDLLDPVMSASMPSQTLIDYMHSKIKGSSSLGPSFRRTERKADEGIPALQVARITLPEILEVKEALKVVVKAADSIKGSKKPATSKKKAKVLKTKGKAKR